MLIIGDVHFDAPVRYQVGGYNLYLEDVKETLGWVLKEVAGEKEDVVFLGDYFERKDKILNKVKNGFLKILRKYIKKKDLRYWFVVGNHDRGQDGELSVDMLRGYGVVVNKKKVVEVGGYKVLLLPWSEVKVEVDYGVDVVLGHFRVDGAEMGVVRDRGENCYRVEEFGDSFVCCGHYHKFQKLADRVYCLGSLVQVDWGDRAKKYVCKLDEWGWRWVEVPMLIDRVVLFVDSIEKLDDVELRDKYVRVDVDIDKVDVKEVVGIIQSRGVKWYEVGLVRSVERNWDDVLVNGDGGMKEDVNRLVREKLMEIHEEFRGIYEKVVRKVLGE